MGLSSLVLVLQMTIVEILCNAPRILGHLVIILVHHDHAVKDTVHWERVLSLNHHLSATALAHSHVRCALLVRHRHWVVAAANHLHVDSKLAWFSV